MADNRSVTITLKMDKNGSGDETNTAKQTSANGSPEAQENDSNSTAKALAVAAVSQVITIAVNEIVNWGEYYWDKELMLNDDYIGQRNKQIAITQTNRFVTSISNQVQAAASGFAIGGPAGAIVFGAISTISEVSKILRSNQQGWDQQNVQLRQMDAQLEFTRSRAGWSTNAASIGEDL